MASEHGVPHEYPPQPVSGRPETAPARSAAVHFYTGKVMHARLRPVAHRFTYSVFSLLIDLDRLEEADRTSRLFSVNRPNVMSFWESDHVDAGFTSLRSYALSLFRRSALAEEPARIALACYPRVLGYVFNPLSVYYAYDSRDELVGLIYEVRNTFGERHSYVCPIEAGEISEAGVRQRCAKVFHVSPFIPMAMRYDFRISIPDERLKWRVLETGPDGPLLSATYSANRMAMTTGNLLRLLATRPPLTWKVIAGIHFEALRLWIKGARFVARPAPPPAVSFKKTSETRHAR